MAPKLSSSASTQSFDLHSLPANADACNCLTPGFFFFLRILDPSTSRLYFSIVPVIPPLSPSLPPISPFSSRNSFSLNLPSPPRRRIFASPFAPHSSAGRLEHKLLNARRRTRNCSTPPAFWDCHRFVRLAALLGPRHPYRPLRAPPHSPRPQHSCPRLVRPPVAPPRPGREQSLPPPGGGHHLERLHRCGATHSMAEDASSAVFRHLLVNQVELWQPTPPHSPAVRSLRWPVFVLLSLLLAARTFVEGGLDALFRALFRTPPAESHAGTSRRPALACHRPYAAADEQVAAVDSKTNDGRRGRGASENRG